MCRPFFFILHIYTPSCAMFLHSVCIGHISYNHTFILHVILHGAGNCRYIVSLFLRLKWINCLVYCRWSGSLCICPVNQHNHAEPKNCGNKNIESPVKHMLCGVPKIHIQFISAVQACQHEFNCSEKLTATLMCFIHKCQPHKALNQVSVRKMFRCKTETQQTSVVYQHSMASFRPCVDALAAV